MIFLLLLFYLPNPQLSPGEVFPNIKAEDVCTPGYAGKTRHVTESTKKEVYRRYGLDKYKPPCPCEVDHIISLQLGGTNEKTNLFPQPYSGEWDAHKKDLLENHLHHLVCTGKITLKEAQEEINGDWTKAYIKYGLDKKGNQGNVVINVE